MQCSSQGILDERWKHGDGNLVQGAHRHRMVGEKTVKAKPRIDECQHLNNGLYVGVWPRG